MKLFQKGSGVASANWIHSASWVTNSTLIHQFGSHIWHHSLTNISLLLLVLLDTLQLAAGATELFSQGATAVVHGCSVCALGPRVNPYTARGVSAWAPPVSITQHSNLSTLRSTPTKGHKQAAFHVRFIEKLVLEAGVVSQQYNRNATYKSKHCNCRYACHSDTQLPDKRKNWTNSWNCSWNPEIQ